MAQTIPIPEEYKDKLDRHEYLLSRTCANIEFFIAKHKEEPMSFDDQAFKRLFSAAKAAAMDYLEMHSYTKDSLLGNDTYLFARINSGHKDHHGYLTVSK